MDLREIRRLIVTAIASDDYLMEQLVLKGGNALELIYGIGNRASVDLDYSIETEFENVELVRTRLFNALRNRFAVIGLVVFDESFALRPATVAATNAKWSGYRATFKLVTAEIHIAWKDDISNLRKRSLAADPQSRREFKIDISKYEYVSSTTETELDGYTIRTYSPSLIAIEKMRALCQQMEEYTQRVHPASRGRDFYDIYSIVTSRGIDISNAENLRMLPVVFAAKDVPVNYLQFLPKYRRFHAESWPAVINAVPTQLEPFDFYFDFVVRQAHSVLEALGEVDSPI